jgi:hypothetical protein
LLYLNSIRTLRTIPTIRTYEDKGIIKKDLQELQNAQKKGQAFCCLQNKSQAQTETEIIFYAPCWNRHTG